MEDESSNESSANSSDEQENSEDQQSTDESSNTKKYATNIYETLLDIYSPGSYCCGGVIEDVCLPGLQIEGVGAIGLPLVESQAKDIAKVCSPAPYGKKEKTIYDTSVRNTEQLDPSKITFKNPRWRECLQKMVSQIADDLGIITPIGCNLYKLLLYKEGSFFKPHRDTEKEDKMFGTLVVQLPSEYQGGELIVKHEKREKVFDYSSECFSISFAAFYADCQHEVKPVTKGYRLCLVYNLIHQGSGALPTPVDISMPVNAIVASLNKWRNDPTGPETLAFKLGHKYSEAALFVDDLKGTDRYECAVMRQACNIASFRLYLAILKVTYTNNNYNPYYDNEDDVETTYSLENFTNMNGKRVNHDQELNSDQIVPEDFMDGLTPDGSDFEEATGNAGATKERWFHTAVMVVWPGQERTKTEPDSKKRKTSK